MVETRKRLDYCSCQRMWNKCAWSRSNCGHLQGKTVWSKFLSLFFFFEGWGNGPHFSHYKEQTTAQYVWTMLNKGNKENEGALRQSSFGVNYADGLIDVWYDHVSWVINWIEYFGSPVAFQCSGLATELYLSFVQMHHSCKTYLAWSSQIGYKGIVCCSITLDGRVAC